MTLPKIPRITKFVDCFHPVLSANPLPDFDKIWRVKVFKFAAFLFINKAFVNKNCNLLFSANTILLESENV